MSEVPLHRALYPRVRARPSLLLEAVQVLGGECCCFFFITLKPRVEGYKSLRALDTSPSQIRALLGTASHFCEVVVLKLWMPPHVATGYSR